MSDTVVEVIEHPLSPYAQKVKIALAEKGVPFSARIPDAMGSGATPDAFRRANFRGEVPVLVVAGRTLFDSTIILEFIEDHWPDPPLLPADPFERARARTIEEVCDTHYEAITWGLSEIANFKRATGELASSMQVEAGEQIGRLNAWLDGELAGSDWFGGERFGWADVCAAPFVQGAAGFGFAPHEESALSRWLVRVRGRPSVTASFEAAKQWLPAMAQVASIVESGGFKRQYRDYRLEWMIRSGGIEVVRRGLERDNIRFNAEPGAA